MSVDIDKLLAEIEAEEAALAEDATRDLMEQAEGTTGGGRKASAYLTADGGGSDFRRTRHSRVE